MVRDAAPHGALTMLGFMSQSSTGASGAGACVELVRGQGGHTTRESLRHDTALHNFWRDIGELVEPNGRIDLLKSTVSAAVDGQTLLGELSQLAGVSVSAEETLSQQAGQLYFDVGELAELAKATPAAASAPSPAAPLDAPTSADRSPHSAEQVCVVGDPAGHSLPPPVEGATEIAADTSSISLSVESVEPPRPLSPPAVPRPTPREALGRPAVVSPAAGGRVLPSQDAYAQEQFRQVTQLAADQAVRHRESQVTPRAASFLARPVW